MEEITIKLTDEELNEVLDAVHSLMYDYNNQLKEKCSSYIKRYLKRSLSVLSGVETKLEEHLTYCDLF